MKCGFFLSVSGLICSVLLHKLSNKALRVKEHCLSEDLEEHAKYVSKHQHL